MRKASIRANHLNFEQRIDFLERLVEQLLQPTGRLTAGDRNVCLEGFTLLLASYWEELIDDDFVDALNRDTTQYARYVGISLPRNLPRDVCFGLLVGYRYLDFRTIEELQRTSRNLLIRQNDPFRHIPGASRRSLNDFFCLRNFLAHRSQKAFKAYASMLRARYGYTRIVGPGQFLRAQHRQTNRRRLFHFLGVIRQVSQAIRAAAPF